MAKVAPSVIRASVNFRQTEVKEAVAVLEPVHRGPKGLEGRLVVFRDAIGGIFDRIAQVLQGAPSEGFTPGA